MLIKPFLIAQKYLGSKLTLSLAQLSPSLFELGCNSPRTHGQEHILENGPENQFF